VLLNALMEYTGTVVFVSHDRYFIDKLATRVFEIGGGKVEIFPGNYEDYLWRKDGGQHVAPTLADVPGMELVGEATPVSPSGKNAGFANASSQPINGHRPTNGDQADTPKKRLNPIKRKQIQDRVRALEEEISGTEVAIANLEAALQNFVSAEQSQRQSQELDQHKAANATLTAEWEQLSEELSNSG